jgi:putative molybdopterin biosynthesis protein
VQREIGFLTRPGRGKPLKLRELAKLRLASRPPSAGVRIHLDTALREEGLDPEKIHRDASLLGSHLEVVLAVVAGRADVGIASRAWGERAGLFFQSLVKEDYGLIVKASSLGDARVVRICEVAQSRAYRSEVGAIPGYTAESAGDIRYDA